MDDVYDFLVHCDWLVPLCGPRTECAFLIAWNLKKRCRCFSVAISDASEFPRTLQELHDLISNDESLKEAICWSVDASFTASSIIFLRIRVAYEPPKGHLSGFMG